MRPFRIGTRGSRLALWQATYVADRLRPVAGDRPVELVEIQTAGDLVRDRPLSQLGGDGAFTKEIQRALLAGHVDVAVHSLKDLPTFEVPGLILAAVPPRAAVGDAFVSSRVDRFEDLNLGAVVATGSLRRRAQVLSRRPDLRVVDVRGNVETRLRKLTEPATDEPALDALILAQAGLERLGLGHVITEILDPNWMLPAVGQGALGLECRADDEDALALVRLLDHLPSRLSALAERAFLRGLGGGCQVPIGALTAAAGGRLTLRGTVISPDGNRRVDGELTAAVAIPAEAEDLGGSLAAEVLGRGARDLLGHPG